MARALRSQLFEDGEEKRVSVRKILNGFRSSGFGTAAVSAGSSEESLPREEKVRDEKGGKLGVREEGDLSELKSRILHFIESTSAKGATVIGIREEVGAPQKALSNILRELVRERKVTRMGARYRQRREG
ncbi:MAG: hypothetical protein HYU39_08945 [Thaumarchaeota archaeon]|nr:hypothetical protein [Nitrososphaerota archaeon]